MYYQMVLFKLDYTFQSSRELAGKEAVPQRWWICLALGLLAQILGSTYLVGVRSVNPRGGVSSRARVSWPVYMVGTQFMSPRGGVSNGSQVSWPRATGPPARWSLDP